MGNNNRAKMYGNMVHPNPRVPFFWPNLSGENMKAKALFDKS